MTIYLQNNWDALRFHYDMAMPEIMDADPWVYGIDPYAWEEVPGMVNMTSIERLVWCDIRQIGLVMYPQVPVLNYFLDFANPVAKVAIECDGKDFHDPIKDGERDARLAEIVWRVYRLPGCYITHTAPDDEYGCSRPNKSETICREIAERHKLSARYCGVESRGELVRIGELMPAFLAKIQARRDRFKELEASGKHARYLATMK